MMKSVLAYNTETMRKLNLGCGPIQPAGWENVDGSTRAWVATRLGWFNRLMTAFRLWSPTEFNKNTRFVNLHKPLPWSNNTVDCIYLGEVLEHFTRDNGARLLSECYRVLKPNGVLRVRVPDNAQFWRNYLKEYDAALLDPQNYHKSQHSRWVEMFFRDICVSRRWRGSFGHYHKWMYDEISLILAFQQAGFVSVERRPYLESSIPDVQNVENRDDLIVEGCKSVAAQDALA